MKITGVRTRLYEFTAGRALGDVNLPSGSDRAQASVRIATAWPIMQLVSRRRMLKRSPRNPPLSWPTGSGLPWFSAQW